LYKYKCPACGGDIEITDNTLRVLSQFEETKMAIETVIKHPAYVTPECADFIKKFAVEQQDTLNRFLSNASQNLPGL
jgi:hypothetical protein